MANNGTMGTGDGTQINPFAPPSADDDVPMSFVTAGAGEASALELRLDVEAFVGKRAAYYWRNWKDALLGEGEGRAIGVHIPAFFLSFGWLIYRKMYKECAILFAATTAVGIAITLAIGESHILERGVGLLLSLLFAGNANRLYLRKARRIIADARVLHVNPRVRREYLARRGGTSVLALFFVFLGVLGLGFFAGRLLGS